MANPLQMLISSFLLLAFLSFSTLADASTVKTSSKDQVACQMCISCENPCPVYSPPPPPPVVLCPPPPPPPPPPEPECPPPPPPEPECPPPPPPEPECPPPPPPTCHECLPCINCKPDAVPSQSRVIGGTAYAPPSSTSGTVPYFPDSKLNPDLGSASTSNIHRKLFDICSAISLLLATILCFF
ncbi:hypothetical protein SLE2022_332080 [Rubroshorea leprosula]